jgi:parallel beta-helix repeat protein
MDIRQLVKFAGTLILVLVLVGGNAFFVYAEPETPNTAYDVTSSDDTPDASLADPLCADSAGNCTLRAAIQQANYHAGFDLITFSINEGGAAVPRIIFLGDDLPVITESVLINGNSQLKGSIQLTGTSAGNSVGLTLKTGASTVKGLAIYDFFSYGMVITGTATVTVSDCIVDSNGGTGIYVTSSGNRIGGVTTADRNFLTNNGDNGAGYGVSLIGLNGNTISNNYIQGNYIGINMAGTAEQHNDSGGISMNSADSNTIGGTGGAAGNVIAGNDTGTGIILYHADNNTIVGNKIGTNSSGTSALGFDYGMEILNSQGNIIGGTASGARNLISGNEYHGIFIDDYANAAPYSDDNEIIGNYIGTDITGNAILGNQNGIYLSDATGTIIGGAESGAGNLISGNDTNGIYLYQNVEDTHILGNHIGVAANGQPLSNGRFGIEFSTNNVHDNQVGGSATGEGNVIAYNGKATLAGGIFIQNGSNDNSLRGNRIFGNGDFSAATHRLGIDLGATNVPDGVTPNDTLDPDTGSNNLQNYPVLTGWSASSSGTLNGTLNSKASTIYIIDIYGNTTCDPIGYGEGEWYIGYKQVTTNASGNASFSQIEAVAPYFTATATDPNGNTSEFSNCLEGANMVFLPIILK